MNKHRNSANKRLRLLKNPLRLAEADLKEIKKEMSSISDGTKDLWTALCEDRVGNKLTDVWKDTESELGLNFMSTRKGDGSSYLVESLTWDGATNLMETHGLSSADAMILNMFFCSKFEAIITSDWEVANAVNRISKENKLAFCPDRIAIQIGIQAGIVPGPLIK